MKTSGPVEHFGATIHHGYDARDIRLMAGEGTLAESRAQCRWDVTVHPKHGTEPFTIVPLICANVHFAKLGLAKVLTNLQLPYTTNPDARVQIALKKTIPEDELVNFMTQHGNSAAWVTVGLKDDAEYAKLSNVFNRVMEGDIAQLKVVIDASNGHMQKMLDRVKQAREIVGDRGVILAGNVVSGNWTKTLIEAGADGIKLNHGPAKVCRTRHNAGHYRPTLTTALECFQAASEAGGFIVPDGGGMSESGTAAVYFAAGAEFLMSGSIFAGHLECDAKHRYDGEKESWYMDYYGSASAYALEEDHGGKDVHRPVEGDIRRVYCKGRLNETLEQWLGGIASATSFQSVEFNEKEHETGENIWRFHYLRNARNRMQYAPR